MSTAFQEKWIRMSAAKQMLAVLTYLAKKETITIPLASLEDIIVGEGLIQSFPDNNLQLTFAPPNTKMFIIGDTVATERSAQWPSSTELPTPQRLRDLTEQFESLPTSTLDDQLMAQREAEVKARQLGVERARRKLEPLPVPTPLVPPS